MTPMVNHPQPLSGRQKLQALIKRAPRRAIAHISDLIRVLAFVILRPAAHLPRRWAFAAADAVGFSYSLSPMGARVRKAMRIAFPGRDDSRLAREWMARPFRDYVSTARIVARRDLPLSWDIESRNAPAILQQSGESVIIATGHFSREPMTGVYMAKFAPKKLAALIAGLDRRSLRPRALRLRIQLGEMIEGIKAVRDRDVEIIHVGQPGVVTRLVRHLRNPDTVVILATDSVAAKGRESGHHRSFAGHLRVDFALGTARLSRLSQRPIVVCVPFLDERGRTVLEWSDPIQAPARDDDGADARVTDAVLDVLERAVGKRPGQYVLPVGEERRWSETSQCWVDLPVSPASSRSIQNPTARSTAEPGVRVGTIPPTLSR